MKRILALLVIICISFFSLTGCGDDNNSHSTKGSTGSTVVAVDPYIIGAVFVELTPEGEFVQRSEPSGEEGRAAFSQKLTAGNSVVMEEPGLHNGVPFKGVLKLKVVSLQDEYIVSPLTTLQVDLDLTPSEVVDLLKSAGIDNISVEDLLVDPMAAADQGDTTLILANLAANAALNTTGTDDKEALKDSIQAVHTLLETLTADVDENGTSDILETESVIAAEASTAHLISAIVAATDYIVIEVEEQVNQGDTPDFDAAATAVDTDLMTGLITEASKDQPVVIAENEGTPEVEVPVGSIKEYLSLAFAAWDSAEFLVVDPMYSETDVDTDKFLAAVDNFLAAKALIGIDTAATDSEIEQARFFGAIAGLAKLADPYSDLTDNGLSNYGDLLDAFGIDTTPRNTFGTIHVEDCVDVPVYYDPIAPAYYEEECTIVELDPNSPSSGDILEALRVNMVARLQKVTDDLDQITSTFKHTHVASSESLMTDSGETEFDYADALLIKGIAKAMIGQINLLLAYDLDIDIATEVERDDAAAAMGLSGPSTFNSFLTDYPSAGALNAGYADFLAEAKSQFSAAADDVTAAVNEIEQEIGADYANPADDQSNEFVALDEELCSWDASYMYYTCTYSPTMTQHEVTEILVGLADFKTGLSNTVTLDRGTPEDPSDDITANFFEIFNGIDLREQAPEYDVTTDTFGLFPDATLGGVVDPAKLNINEDLDQDGAPDLLNEYTRFFSDMLFPGGVQQSQTSTYTSFAEGYGSEQFVFAEDGSLSYSWRLNFFTTQPPQELVPTQGTWEIDIDSGELVISFATPVANWRNGATMDEIRVSLEDAEVDSDFSYLDVLEDHILGGSSSMGPTYTSWYIMPN